MPIDLKQGGVREDDRPAHKFATRIQPRNRLSQVAAAAGVIVLGLFSRSGIVAMPRFVSKYAGDGLWALMIFLLAGMFFPRRSALFVGLVAFAYACATEFTQLVRTPWLDRIRHTIPGRLVLGDTFAWADMAAYLVGVLVGIAIETALARRRAGQLVTPA